MYIKRIEEIHISQRENEALDIVYNMLSEIEDESTDEDVKRIVEHITAYLDSLMDYIEER